MGDMDSGNSGSFQSSSGGDEDYESSRGGVALDSFSTLLNHNHNHNHQSNYPAAGHVSSSLNQAAGAFFDPLASYFDHLSRSTNLDPVWPKDSMLNLPPSSSVSAAFDSPHPSSTSAPADPQINQTPGGGGGGGGAVRNPKKRTRASRKAPTTVLTTDTTNFRAMVQEFTGIPAPPFTGGGGSLFLPRTRLDLFGGRMDALATSNNLSPYLLRPIAQKIPTQLLSTNKNGTHTQDVLASSSAGANYHIPDLGLFATNVPPNLSFGSDLVSSKPGSAAALQVPITTTARNDEVRDDLGGITASFFPTSDGVSSSSGKNEGGGGGPLGWAEGLGLAADAGAPAHSTTPGSRHSHHRPHNLGFSHP